MNEEEPEEVVGGVCCCLAISRDSLVKEDIRSMHGLKQTLKFFESMGKSINLPGSTSYWVGG